MAAGGDETGRFAGSVDCAGCATCSGCADWRDRITAVPATATTATAAAAKTAACNQGVCAAAIVAAGAAATAAGKEATAGAAVSVSLSAAVKAAAICPGSSWEATWTGAQASRVMRSAKRSGARATTGAVCCASGNSGCSSSSGPSRLRAAPGRRPKSSTTRSGSCTCRARRARPRSNMTAGNAPHASSWVTAPSTAAGSSLTTTTRSCGQGSRGVTGWAAADSVTMAMETGASAAHLL